MKVDYTEMYSYMTRCIGEDARKEIHYHMSQRDTFNLVPAGKPDDEDEWDDWDEFISEYESEEWNGSPYVPFKLAKDGENLIVSLHNTDTGAEEEAPFNELSYYMWCIIANMVESQIDAAK